MSVSPLILQFVEDELSRAAALAERTIAATAAQLQQPAKVGSVTAGDRKVRQDTVEALLRGAHTFAQLFTSGLRTLVMDDVQGTDRPAAGGQSTAVNDLQLMDETRIEADIETARAAQVIDSTAEWELRELQTFTSTLIGQTHVSAQSNPLRPSVYARALWEACSAVCPTPVQRNLLLHTAASVMATQLKMAWAAACTRLESQGVAPSIYRTTVLTDTSTAAPPVTTPQAFAQSLQQISTALHEQSSRTRPTPISSAMPASAVPGIPSIARPQQPTNLPAGIDPQVVELLSRIFEVVLLDPQLSAGLRTVMARLQTSVLRLCLVDHALLDTHQHPVWLLMNRIAHAARLWPQPNDPRAERLLTCCESLASDMAAALQPTPATFSKGLAQLEAHLDHELTAQKSLADNAIATLMMVERRDVLEHNVSRQLAEQAQRVPTPPLLREFLLQDWARVIAESTLRYGGEDSCTADALKTASDLLWSLQIPDHPQSRQRLLTLLPDLLKRVRAGMALVALPEAHQQAVLDALMVVHTESLRPGEQAHARATTPQNVFQRPHGDAPSTANYSSAQGLTNPLIEAHSMDTVPAELVSDGEPPEAGLDRQVDAMTPGTSARWFLSGRWHCVQLLWRSDALNYFVFAGESAGHTHSITRSALMRLISEGLLKPLADTQLIQRAVRRVMRDLAESR